MNKEKIKQTKRARRRIKIRARISGTKDCPRFSVFRSSKSMYLQLIDDTKGRTLVSAHTKEIDKKKIKKDEQYTREIELGKLIAKKAMEKKINKVVFDRGGYKYHGRVKAAAEGAREGGLIF